MSAATGLLGAQGMETPLLPWPPHLASLPLLMKTVRNRFPFCYVTGFSLSPDLGVLFLFGVEVHAAAAAPGEGGGDPRARTVLPRLMPASRLRETQRTAYLAADRAASLHHDLLSCNGARFNHSLHDGWRGDEIKKFEKKKRENKNKNKNKTPAGIRWSAFTAARGGCREPPCSARRIQLRARSPLPAGLAPPPARQTSPARCGRLHTGCLRPRARRTAGRGAPRRGGGACVWAAAGEGGRARASGRRREWLGKKPRLGEKCWATQGDVMRAAAPANATQLQPTGGARLPAREPPRLRDGRARSAAR